jgi:hypothetical protein
LQALIIFETISFSCSLSLFDPSRQCGPWHWMIYLNNLRSPPVSVNLNYFAYNSLFYSLEVSRISIYSYPPLSVSILDSCVLWFRSSSVSWTITSVNAFPSSPYISLSYTPSMSQFFISWVLLAVSASIASVSGSHLHPILEILINEFNKNN